MKKIIWKKKTDDTNTVVRRCLNCGSDISNKRKDSRFCCNICYRAYNDIRKKLKE